MTVRRWTHPVQDEEDLEEIPGYNRETGLVTSDDWTVHPLETGDFQTEDVWICEKVQRGLASPAFRPGPLALGIGAEDPLAWFQDMLLDRL